jgi:taurine transport system permease protein
VTFGDESAVKPEPLGLRHLDRLTIFLIWGAFTGSKWCRFLHARGPFSGTTEFTYTAENAAATDDATVVCDRPSKSARWTRPRSSPAMALPRTTATRSADVAQHLIRAIRNDEGRDEDGYKSSRSTANPSRRAATVG